MLRQNICSVCLFGTLVPKLGGAFRAATLTEPSARKILEAIPGVELVEPEYWTENKGLCCGAGGAQMWMEEQNKDRINAKRTTQLLETGATTIATACPFCMTMLTDGIKDQEKEDQIKQLDIAELLAISCGVEESGQAASSPEPEAAE